MTNEQAIEELRYFKVHEYGLSDSTVDLALQALEKQINHRWIPSSEKPKKSGWYLCTFNGDVCRANEVLVAMSLFDSKKGIWDHDKFVLAWKPLSEPYKGDNNAKDD